ncbi:MAG: proprotein convertase P-domain-containing protein [Sedimentisphaerales bacterium]|nr:proprotein convertase P-domain-containing protein [Sedimentisphaerales bacterium]
MDTLTQKQRIVALLAITLTFCPIASAALTYLYIESFDLPIPAPPETGHAWMNDAAVPVGDSFEIIDLDVAVTLTHTAVFDLQIFLEGPDGTRIILNQYDPTGEYFDGQDYHNTIFDDQADTPIESADAPFTGRFRPKAPAQLSIFNGRDAQGQWKIQIYDWWYDNTGTLEEVRLAFTAAPEPATLTILIFALPIIRSRR